MNHSEYAALVLVPQSQNFNVLGYTPLERTLIALEKTGVGVACLLTTGAESLRAALSKNVQGIDLYFFDPPEEMAAKKKAAERNPKSVFIFQQPLVVDLSILQDLVKMTGAHPNVSTAGGEILLLQLADFQSDGRRSPVVALPADQRACHPVRTKEELKAVKKRLIAHLTKPSDGWVSRRLNRPISTRISRVLAYTNVTPNQVTFVNGLAGFSSCYFMYEGGYWNWLIGGAIIHLTSVVDGVDGEIARLKFKHSKFGRSLDTFFDYTTALAALVCLVFGVRNTGLPEFYFQAGIAAGIFTVLALASLIIYVQRFKKGGAAFNEIGYSYKDKTTTFAKLMNYLDVFGKRDFYNFIFFLFGIFGVMPWALVYVAVMTFMVFAFSVQANFVNVKK